MIKTASAISLALLLCACGGSQANKGGGETAPLGPEGEAAAEAPAADGENMKAAEPAAAPEAAGAPAASGEAVTMTDAEKDAAVAFSEKLADVVDANKGDCDKMAAEIKTLFDDNAALITKANQWQQSATKEEQKAFEEKYKPRLEAMGAKLGGGIQKCSAHDGVLAQFQRFQ